MNRNRAAIALITTALVISGCRRETTLPPPPPRPSILFVTLDTTRADAAGPEAVGVSTPSFNALAA